MSRTRIIVNRPGKEVLDEMRAAIRGERPLPTLPESEALDVLDAEALELLRVLEAQQPTNISTLAQSLGRTKPEIVRSLQHLAERGAIRVTRQGREVLAEIVDRQDL